MAIVGRIQIDGHQAGTVVQPLGMTPDHAARQRLAQTIELPGSDRVFKARQRRLRGQINSRNRITVQQHFVNGIGPETGRVVGIGIAAGNREHALRKQISQRMIDLPSVRSSRRQPAMPEINP